MDITVDIQVAVDGDDTPEPDQIRSWIGAILNNKTISASIGSIKPIEISVRIVDSNESQTLNAQYRDKNKPTNVLSFPADLPESLPVKLLGDLVICAPVVKTEAAEQGKPITAHWAHMVTHGTLHLLGYDHIDDDDADIMETLETKLLAGMGFNDPYLSEKNIDKTA